MYVMCTYTITELYNIILCRRRLHVNPLRPSTTLGIQLEKLSLVTKWQITI